MLMVLYVYYFIDFNRYRFCPARKPNHIKLEKIAKSFNYDIYIKIDKFKFCKENCIYNCKHAGLRSTSRFPSISAYTDWHMRHHYSLISFQEHDTFVLEFLESPLL